MKKLLLIPILILVVSLVLPIPAAASNPQTIPLVAGQNTTVGTVVVSNDGTNLSVVFNVNSPWQIEETHLAVALSAGDLPVNKKGNPQIGKFPYSEADGNYTIPLYIPSGPDAHDWRGERLYIAAHAVVSIDGCGEETGWGMGEHCGGVFSVPFTVNGGSWAHYFYYDVTGF